MLTLRQLPMRTDNYSYALIVGNDAIIIDPSDESGCQDFLAAHPDLTVKAILNTHSHHDHVGGNSYLRHCFSCPIYGPLKERDRIPKLTHAVSGDDLINIMGLKISVHDVHAHTVGHVAFFVHHALDEIIKHGHDKAPFLAHPFRGKKVMFVGDSLFAAGCGRLFEGTPHDLLAALTFYSTVPQDVLMACAHEYTKANLAFAEFMFPGHAQISARRKEIDRLLHEEGSSIPCLFREEQTTNPFLLALKDPEKAMAAEKFGILVDDLPAIVKALRAAKDQF